MKALHLATAEDAAKLLPMVEALHAHLGLPSDAAHRHNAIQPLLDGAPFGAIWLIGPRRAPVGYIALSFGWSIEFGGMEATVDEFYIRSAVRQRGMGSEALLEISKAMTEAGVKALHLEAAEDDARLHDFYRRARFSPREGYQMFTKVL